MTTVVFLDTGVLGLITHPAAKQSEPCMKWMSGLLGKGVRICFAEICDYELRRKLIQIGSADSIQKLDELKELIEYIPIDTAAMQQAADLWAQARSRGIQRAGNEDLDGDVIQVAQAKLTAGAADDLVIATDNVRHLGVFLPAKKYEEIVPK